MMIGSITVRLLVVTVGSIGVIAQLVDDLEQKTKFSM